MATSNDDFEIEYFTKILKFYNNKPQNNELVQIWKSKSFIELMRFLERTNNKEFVQKAIIVILSLFEETPPDIYNNRGIDANLIKKKEKKTFLSVLKSEFTDVLPN